jgi:hypothetical protein
MSAPTTPEEDETVRWFDEEFASTIKLTREPSATDFESYMQKLEHRELMTSIRRRRRGSERTT